MASLLRSKVFVVDRGDSSMTDITDLIDHNSGKTLREALHDNGDGTYSRQVAVIGGIAQDGTDSTDANATQATGGVGIRGWLSTLVSLFRGGLARVSTNAMRAAPITLWSAVAAPHKLAAGGTITATPTTGGSLVSATTYYATVTPYNAYGSGPPGPQCTFSPGGSNTAEHLAFAQVTGAAGYHITCSTDSGASKCSCSITEAERAAGCVETATGTVTTGGVAGSVTIQTNSTTGIAVTAPPFTADNAYTPSGMTMINCAGKSLLHYFIEFVPSRIWTATAGLPSLTIIPVSLNQAGAYHFGPPLQIYFASQAGMLYQVEDYIQVDGGQVGLLVDSIANGTVSASGEMC
jgi:hypothetical protein